MQARMTGGRFFSFFYQDVLLDQLATVLYLLTVAFVFLICMLSSDNLVPDVLLLGQVARSALCIPGNQRMGVYSMGACLDIANAESVHHSDLSASFPDLSAHDLNALVKLGGEVVDLFSC